MTSAGRDTAWSLQETGVAVRVRLTPKSSRDAIEGLTATAEGTALKARVRAVPEEGAANDALERLVAKWLGVSKSSVSIATGHKSRVKTLRIAGDPAALERALRAQAAVLDEQPDTDRS